MLIKRSHDPDFSYLVKKQSAHAAKLKLLYEQCGNHAEEYYPNIISNYGEELPVECEHEINSLFPSKRISGPDFVLNFIRKLVQSWKTPSERNARGRGNRPILRILSGLNPKVFPEVSLMVRSLIRESLSQTKGAYTRTLRLSKCQFNLLITIRTFWQWNSAKTCR